MFRRWTGSGTPRSPDPIGLVTLTGGLLYLIPGLFAGAGLTRADPF